MNKLVHIIILSLCITVFWSCNGDAPANGAAHDHNHGGHDHNHDHGKTAVPHDHDGDGKPDHAPGEHGKTAVPHDHDGDGVPDHGPGAHGKNEKHPDPNHPSNDPNVQGEYISDEEYKRRMARIEAKQEEAKTMKPTAEMKATGDKICECLEKLDIYKKTVAAKSQEQFNQLAGDAPAEEVAMMQTCHTQYMKAAIRPIPDQIDRSIYGFKAREHIARKCLRGNEQFWFYMGKYVADRTPLNPK